MLPTIDLPPELLRQICEHLYLPGAFQPCEFFNGKFPNKNVWMSPEPWHQDLLRAHVDMSNVAQASHRFRTQPQDLNRLQLDLIKKERREVFLALRMNEHYRSPLQGSRNLIRREPRGDSHSRVIMSASSLVGMMG